MTDQHVITITDEPDGFLREKATGGGGVHPGGERWPPIQEVVAQIAGKAKVTREWSDLWAGGRTTNHLAVGRMGAYAFNPEHNGARVRELYDGMDQRGHCSYFDDECWSRTHHIYNRVPGILNIILAHQAGDDATKGSVANFIARDTVALALLRAPDARHQPKSYPKGVRMGGWDGARTVPPTSLAEAIDEDISYLLDGVVPKRNLESPDRANLWGLVQMSKIKTGGGTLFDWLRDRCSHSPLPVTRYPVTVWGTETKIMGVYGGSLASQYAPCCWWEVDFLKAELRDGSRPDIWGKTSPGDRCRKTAKPQPEPPAGSRLIMSTLAAKGTLPGGGRIE